MRLGPPGAAAARPVSPFPAVGNLCWSSAPLESPLPTPRHPGYVFSQTWIFFWYRETTREITAGLSSCLPASPHRHAFTLGGRGTLSWANEHPQPQGREMKEISAAEWKLCSSVLSSAICPFKLHCNTGRISPTRARTSLPAAFLRPRSLSVFLFSALLLLGWPRDDFVAAAAPAGALAAVDRPAGQRCGRWVAPGGASGPLLLWLAGEGACRGRGLRSPVATRPPIARYLRALPGPSRELTFHVDV